MIDDSLKDFIVSTPVDFSNIFRISFLKEVLLDEFKRPHPQEEIRTSINEAIGKLSSAYEKRPLGCDPDLLDPDLYDNKEEQQRHHVVVKENVTIASKELLHEMAILARANPGLTPEHENFLCVFNEMVENYCLEIASGSRDVIPSPKDAAAEQLNPSNNQITL